MKEILYYIFVFPLESVLGFVFNWFIGLSHSAGLSIVLLSILVNLFLLKLFFLADRTAKNHGLVKEALDIKIAEFKRVFKGAELYTYIATLYRQKHYHPIFALKALGGLALQVPFFVAIVFLFEFHSPELQGVSFGVIPDLSKADGLLGGINLLPILMSCLTLINVWVSSKDRGSRIQGVIITLIFLVLLYGMPSSLLVYWTTSMAFALVKTCFIVFASKYRLKTQQGKKINRIFRFDFLFDNNTVPSERLIYCNFSTIIITTLCLIVFIYNPFALYSSDLSQFDIGEIYKTLAILFGFFLFGSIFLVYLMSFLYKTRFLKISCWCLCSFLFVAFIYNFILNYDVINGREFGQLDHFVFKTGISFDGLAYLFVDCIALFASLIVSFIVIKYIVTKKVIFNIFSFFLGTLIITSLVIFGMIVYNREKIGDLEKSKSEIYNGENINLLPDYSSNLLSLSRTEKNIIIFMSDAFSGEHFHRILQENPEYQRLLSGFTYYPNTLSSDGHTMLTAHMILAGHQTSIFANRNGGLKQYADTVDEFLFETLKQYASTYDVSIFGIPYLSERTQKGYKEHKINFWVTPYDFLDYYKSLHTKEIKDANEEVQKKLKVPIGELISFGVFSMSPYKIRKRIYTSHGWIFGSKNNIDLFEHGLRNVSTLASIVKHFNIKNQKPTFKYIYTAATHLPFVLDPNTCRPTLEFASKNNNTIPNPDLYNGHYASEICAIRNLIEFVRFLKTYQVYNNTMIVFVSDHSYDDVLSSRFGLGNNPNPILLIKDFSAFGNLKIDNRLMSNADVAGIVCDVALGGCHGIEKNILKNYPQHRKLFHTFAIHWTAKAKTSNHVLFEKIWEVQENIYNPKNWRDVTEQFKK